MKLASEPLSVSIVTGLILEAHRQGFIAGLQEAANLPLEVSPDHPEERGYAAHLRTQISRTVERLTQE